MWSLDLTGKQLHMDGYLLEKAGWGFSTRESRLPKGLGLGSEGKRSVGPLCWSQHYR